MVARHGENPDPDYYLMFPGHRLEISDCLIVSLAETMYQKDGGTDIPVGYTYLGQFIAHDITHFIDPADKTLLKQLSAVERHNRRTPSLDLDSLYGHPSGFGSYIDSKDGKFVNKNQTEEKGRIVFFDLPRDEQGNALIGDGKNDENLFVAQMHLLFMSAHNRLYDLYSDQGAKDPFKEARKELTLIYQRIIQDDFLYRILNHRVFEALFRKSGALYLLDISPEDRVYMKLPHEFSAAAFRFGHSLVRSDYNIRFQGEILPQNIRQFFKLTGRGGEWEKIRPDQFSMAWDEQVDLSRYKVDNNYQEAEMIDTHFISEMLSLPMEPSGKNNIIARNLGRAMEFGIGSGQSVIRAINSGQQGGEYCEQMGLEVLDFDKVKNNDMQTLFDNFDLRSHMPLWTYVLIEPAQHFPSHIAHTRLGTLGSLLVGEVFRALLLTSRTSLLDKGFDSSQSVFLRDIKSRFPERESNGDKIGLEDLVAFVHF